MPLQAHRPFLLHRLTRIVWIFLSRLVILVLKILFLIVTGFRRLKVDTVTVNNAFLLANGVVTIQWRVRNALWIRVDRKWMGGRGNQVLVLTPQARQTVVIQIQGLFSSYEKRFDINPLARIMVRQPCLPEWKLSIKGSGLYPVLSPDLHRSIGIAIRPFRPILPPMPLAIPPILTIQTENQYEKRLLHHS